MTSARGIGAAFRGALGAFTLDAVFDTPAFGITALFGPSGCGKTAVLRCIAGLTRLSSSSCAVDGETWQDETTFLPTWRRPVGYVFQEASLFPHLSVKRNLLYGAKGSTLPDGPQSIGFDEVMDLLGLERLLERSPRNLSGGERQRVAIGRALLSRPKLLLMDEPLSALDRLTKDEILPFLERLHERLSLPVIYVSHDMTEIERLADHLVLMHEGRVIASGKLATLQSDPNLPLAVNRDAAVAFDAVVEGYDETYGLLALRIEGGQLLVPASPLAKGAHRRLRIAASDVSLLVEPQQPSSILNALQACIVTRRPIGENELIVVLGLGSDGAGARLLSRITRRSWERLGLVEGGSIWAQIKGVSLAHK
jgi:molybdate transport system ATP-binding protein